jgi:hypothetical protein
MNSFLISYGRAFTAMGETIHSIGVGFVDCSFDTSELDKKMCGPLQFMKWETPAEISFSHVQPSCGLCSVA